jgi:protein ImuB
MKRIVSVFLPDWSIERLALKRGVGPSERLEPDAPFALVETGARGVRLSAVDAAAKSAGIRAGDALADARAMLPTLRVAEADPAADRDGLRKLALWLGRYGLIRNAYGLGVEIATGTRLRCYGLWVDIAGVDHLYGGEAALLADLGRRLYGFGLTAHLGLADTFGAAHALAWHGRGSPRAEPRATLAAVAHLPLAALRLDAKRVNLLNRLGFKTIGMLAHVPRAALERRFRSSLESERVLQRLDQALGARDEPRRPLVEPPTFSVRQSFAEPLCSAAQIETEIGRLMSGLCAELDATGVGVCALRFTFYRCDGTAGWVRVGTSRPAREAAHLTGLLVEKLEQIDLGFGVDLLTLEAVRVERLVAAQDVLTRESGRPVVVLKAELIDRLVNRLGEARVTHIAPYASHWPERSEVRRSALLGAQTHRTVRGMAAGGTSGRPHYVRRPIVLLSAPEPIVVLAEIPEGAPVRFTWRRVMHTIVRTEGPERIEPEWWRELRLNVTRSRDYYALEDQVGGRFWVFRAGRYDDCEEEDEAEQRAPGWFVHGLFG